MSHLDVICLTLFVYSIKEADGSQRDFQPLDRLLSLGASGLTAIIKTTVFAIKLGLGVDIIQRLSPRR